MTLNVTVVTPRTIYQCADYRLLDLSTKKTRDYGTQKIALVNTLSWSATVCFAGVGTYNTTNVGDWLAKLISSFALKDGSFESFLGLLKTADSWLSQVPHPHNRHTFSVGAFVGSTCHFARISNYESLTGAPTQIARRELDIYHMQPKRPWAFVSGQTKAVSKSVLKELIKLTISETKAEVVHKALARLNRRAAEVNGFISPGCFTTELDVTGRGSAYPHDATQALLGRNLTLLPEAAGPIESLLDTHFGKKQWMLKGMTTVRQEPTEEFHRTLLRERPDDPQAHSNYGAYLQDVCKDVPRAEQEYRRALELDANHVNALGNLANIQARKGLEGDAEKLYRKALDIDPGHENVSWNYSNFLTRVRKDDCKALTILEAGIRRNPQSNRLLLRKGDLLLRGYPGKALMCYRAVKDSGYEPKEVEGRYATALHMSGEPVGSCIQAYRIAMSHEPGDANLKVNLSQVLFLNGRMEEAAKELREAMQCGLDASGQLEGYFYMLAHTEVNKSGVLENVRRLIAKGARSEWNFLPNIEHVGQTDSKRATTLRVIAEVMGGKRDPRELDGLVFA